MSRIYWDSMLFIYLIEGNPEFGPRVRAIHEEMVRRGDILCTSVFTLGEVLTGPRKVGAQTVVDRIRNYFLKSGRVELLPLTLSKRRTDIASFELAQPRNLPMPSIWPVQRNLVWSFSSRTIRRCKNFQFLGSTSLQAWTPACIELGLWNERLVATSYLLRATCLSHPLRNLGSRMKNIGRASALLLLILGWSWVAILCAGAPALAAQATSPGNTVSGEMRGVINLDDSWRFQEGDDPRWADPAFDDKDWTSVVLSKPLVEQGAVFHNGYGWYRLRLQPQQIAGLGSAGSRTQLLLLVTSNSVGQLTVYVNGAEAGHTRGMTERPSEYQSPPFVVQVPGDGAAPITLGDSKLGGSHNSHPAWTSREGRGWHAGRRQRQTGHGDKP